MCMLWKKWKQKNTNKEKTRKTFRPNVKQREMGLWMLDKDTIRKC